MENIFNLNAYSCITEANINYYKAPFFHPKRKMKETDFIYILDGEWKMGQNDEIFPLKKDSLLILKANELHFGVAPCKSSTKTMYFHVDEGANLNSENEITIPSLSDASLNRNIKKIFYEIVNAKLSNDAQKANILYKLLLCELRDINSSSHSADLPQKIKDLIHKSPEAFFTNAQIAQRLGVSVKTAETKFKAQFNMTIHNYILHFKIERATIYIKNFPEMQLKEIAVNLGFYDEYHFSKQFKKIIGISPSQYKNQI